MRITPVIIILSEKNVMVPGRNIEVMRPAVNKKNRTGTTVPRHGMTESQENSGKGTIRAIPAIQALFMIKKR
jgi:hypothetical protein